MSAIRVDDVIVGERRRQDAGDIAALAASLDRFGLIHPIVIDGANHLVCGGRRLEAAKRLGWEEIEARVRWELSPDELRELELEENLQRKDLTEIELSREMVRKAKQIAPAISSMSDEKAPQGRPSAYGAPKDDIAQAIGVAKGTLVNAEQHVAAVERYPELEPLAQQPAIALAKAMDTLPEPERAEAHAALTALPVDKRRRVAREQAKAESEQSTALLELVGDPDGAIARAALIAGFSKVRATVSRQLVALDVAALAAVLDDAGWESVGWFAHDTRKWLDALEAARPMGLRLVGRN